MTLMEYKDSITLNPIKKMIPSTKEYYLESKIIFVSHILSPIIITLRQNMINYMNEMFHHAPKFIASIKTEDIPVLKQRKYSSWLSYCYHNSGILLITDGFIHAHYNFC